MRYFTGVRSAFGAPDPQDGIGTCRQQHALREDLDGWACISYQALCCMWRREGGDDPAGAARVKCVKRVRIAVFCETGVAAVCGQGLGNATLENPV